MLIGIDPLLTGELLWRLDAMGHGDTLLVSDAHFPLFENVGSRLALPGIRGPQAVRAVTSVFPLDEGICAWVMDAPSAADAVLSELRNAAHLQPENVTSLGREAFYARSRTASLLVRTGETRPFGNILLTKGLVTS
ncbi:hypothetical protein B7R22_14125 [Subtercola boreus]|uniref:Uncharacterized protein n=1 Tax=Subtercola boreus TaxID=120213 RepID=A0A3E0VUU8_9MICO|nr:RbsD/FucU domain-containing protein [Subtercola boreus]RFA13133.1 hypothetical protein B7R22_14125 [Subtercola boreus]